MDEFLKQFTHNTYKFSLTDDERKLADFTCAVCERKATKEGKYNALGCAWLCLDNDYCPEIYQVCLDNRVIEKQKEEWTV